MEVLFIPPVFLIFLSFCCSEKPQLSITERSQNNTFLGANKKDWRLKQLNYPNIVLYDNGLSDSLSVSLSISQSPNNSNASFTFSHPAFTGCSNLAYILVLTTSKNPAPRLEGPVYQTQCLAQYKITVYNLKTDSDYMAHLIAYNKSITLKSSSLSFTTTEVFLATIEKGNDHVMITCHFTDHSQAKGCFVQMKILQDFTLSEYSEEVYITRTNNDKVASRCIMIPSGSYAEKMDIKDWKFDSRIGSHSVATFTSIHNGYLCPRTTSWKRPYMMFLLLSLLLVGTLVVYVLFNISSRQRKRSSKICHPV